MRDDAPAPEPGTSLAADDRGLSVTLGYTLTLSITAVLIAGLLIAGGTLIEDQRRAIASDELTVSGQQLAGGFEDVDRLAAAADDGTVRVNVWLPDDVGAGGGYSLRVVNHPTPADQPARATVVVTAETIDVSRNVSFRTQHPVTNRTLPGGPVTIRFADGNGDGKYELVVAAADEREIAPDPPEPAAFGHEEIVFVDDDTGELKSVAPGEGVTGYGVDARAIGPKQVDLDGDGLREIPFVTSSNELRLVDENGETQTLAGDAAYSPGDYISLLAVGTWNGSTSVFYLNNTDTVDGQPSIYRAGVDGAPEQVTVNGNGIDAMAVGGIGDMNDDGDDDLVFVAGSTQEATYVDDGETKIKSVGASAGYGFGDPRQFDDGERDGMPFVSGGNGVKIYRDSGSSSFAGGATKTSVAGIDWTGDDTLELVYIDSTDGTLRYVTLGGSTGSIVDADGDTITVDEDAGVA
jgi:hypothetical protein